MTTPAAALAGTPRSAPARAPYRCVACGEPLFTRALACPHCGAPDPVAAEAPPATEVSAAELPGQGPAADAPATDFPPVAASPVHRLDDDDGVPPADAAPSVAGPEPGYAELEPVEGDATGPAMPRAPRPPTGSSRLDIAPEPYEDDLSESRDLVLVPERGGRTIMLPEPRRRRSLVGVVVAGLVVIGIGAAALFGWRMLSGPAAVAAREMTVDTAWTDVPLDAGAGEWVVTADAPFRIRVDGTVYTVGTQNGIAIPLDGREIAVRAVSGATSVTFTRR